MKTSKIIQDLKAKIKPENRNFIAKNLEITQEVYSLLSEKGWTQKELATLLEKSESEVSKWLSGLHNLTLKSITKLETVLGADIIVTPGVAKQKYQTIRYVPLMVESVDENQLGLEDDIFEKMPKRKKQNDKVAA